MLPYSYIVSLIEDQLQSSILQTRVQSQSNLAYVLNPIKARQLEGGALYNRLVHPGLTTS